MSIREDLKAYVDGELSPERAAQVQAAIDADPALLQEVTFMKLLSRSIKESAQEPQPTGMEDTLRAVAPPRRHRPWLFRLSALQYAAAAGTVFLLAVVLFPIFAQSKSAAKRAGETAASSMPAADAFRYRNGATDGVMAEGQGMDREQAKLKTPLSSMPGRALERDTGANVAPEIALRQIVRTADLSVLVKSASDAQANATTMAQGLGGFIEQSNLSAPKDSDPVARVVMRVPERRFDEAMKALRALGEVESESVGGQDVTGQIVDVEARLRTLRGEEEQYRLILRNTRRIGEVLEVRDRLGQVRQEIEVLTAQRASLKNLAALSTISVQFKQRLSGEKDAEGSGWAEDTWAGAVQGLQGVGRFLAQAAITLFVYSPVWAPIALVVWLIARRSKAG